MYYKILKSFFFTPAPGNPLEQSSTPRKKSLKHFKQFKPLKRLVKHISEPKFGLHHVPDAPHVTLFI